MRKFLILSFPFVKQKFDAWDVGAAGLSLIGGIWTNSTNKKIAREQMALQEKMFNTQMDYTKAAEQRQYDYADLAWERETAYNDPAAQRARFEAAGLNPALMMQGQNAAIGSSESVSSPSAPSAPTSVGYQVQDPITPAIQSYLTSRSVSAQARKTEEEANQVAIDNRTREVQNVLQLSESRQQILKLISERQKNNADTSYLYKLLDFTEEQLAIMEQSHNALVNQENQKAYLLNQQGQHVEEQAKALQIDNFFRKLEHEVGIHLSRAQIKRIGSQIDLDRALSKTESAQYAKTILEAAGLVPGTPQYKRASALIKAQILNLRKGRFTAPFGFGIDFMDTRDHNYGFE